MKTLNKKIKNKIMYNKNDSYSIGNNNNWCSIYSSFGNVFGTP